MHSDDGALREMGTEQVPKVFSCSLTVQAYVQKDSRIYFIFIETFNASGLSMGLLNCRVFMEHIIETVVNGRRSPFSKMRAPQRNIQVVICFHALRYFKFLVQSKTLHENRNGDLFHGLVSLSGPSCGPPVYAYGSTFKGQSTMIS